MQKFEYKLIPFIVFMLLIVALTGCELTRSGDLQPPPPQDSVVEVTPMPSVPADEGVLVPTEDGQATEPGGEDTDLPPATLTPTKELAQPESSPTTVAILPTPTAIPPDSQPLPTPTAIQALPTAVAPPTSAPSVGEGNDVIHVIQAGENLFRIALKYGLDQNTLATYNGISNPNVIYVGQRLKIPQQGSSPDTVSNMYTVKEGDTLTSIARQFNITTEMLMSANNLSNEDFIFVGQELIIPIGSK